MNLIECLTWAITELHVVKPDVQLVRQALEDTLQQVIKLDIQNECRALSLIRIAKVHGEGYSDFKMHEGGV